MEEPKTNGFAETKIEYIRDLDSIVDGVSFMNATIANMEQKRRETAVQGGQFVNSAGKHTYVKIRWEGEDLVINNIHLCHCGSTVTRSVAIHTKLALKMGWLRKVVSGLNLGPNLEQEFMGDQIPDVKSQSDRNDLDDAEGNPVFWSIQPSLEDYLQLSMSCSWRFANLNTAFGAVVGMPTRPLHVYSDVAGSTIVGNQVTDLLREVKYQRQGRGTTYYEPYTFNTYPFATSLLKSLKRKWRKRMETWPSLGKEIPLSSCTSEEHKKARSLSFSHCLTEKKKEACWEEV